MGRLKSSTSGNAMVRNMFSLTPVMASTKDISWPSGSAALVSGDQLKGAPKEAVAFERVEVYVSSIRRRSLQSLPDIPSTVRAICSRRVQVVSCDYHLLSLSPRLHDKGLTLDINSGTFGTSIRLSASSRSQASDRAISK